MCSCISILLKNLLNISELENERNKVKELESKVNELESKVKELESDIFNSKFYICPKTGKSIKYSNIMIHFKNKGKKICSICYDESNVNKKCLIKTQCNHFFHAECITKWCNISNDCPICRKCNPISVN